MHYLSAFLSAGRSVTLALQREEKDKYDAWFNDWKRDKCTENERELMDHMVRQRNEALKRGEAETELSEGSSQWSICETIAMRTIRHTAFSGLRRLRGSCAARILSIWATPKKTPHRVAKDISTFSNGSSATSFRPVLRYPGGPINVRVTFLLGWLSAELRISGNSDHAALCCIKLASAAVAAAETSASVKRKPCRTARSAAIRSR